MSPWSFLTWWKDTRWGNFFCTTNFPLSGHGWKKCCSKRSTAGEPGSNQRPFDLQSNALATELSRLQSFVAFWSVFEIFSVLQEQMFLELSFCCFWMLKIFFLLPKICWKSCRKTRKGAGSSELESFSRSLQQLSYLNCLVTLPIEPLQCFAACRSKFCIFLWFGS